jgi:tetratricopeptide (TPR) repeat protein
VPAISPEVPVPDSAVLETPEPIPAPASSLDTPETGESAEGSPLGDTGVNSQHSGQYYDSMALVPDSNLEKAGVTGPRKVDPVYEPGQRFISVQRDAGPTAFESQFVAATRALKLGRYAAAMEMFEKLYRQNHSDQRVLMGLAVAQQGAGFVESAARTYEELLSIAPDNADAAVNLMGIMKAQYPSVTLQNLMELRGKYPTNPGIPAQIGLVNAEMQNYDDALRYLEIAASMDPRNASHVYNMAIISDRKGDIRAAISFYQRALELDSAYSDSASALPRDQIYDRLSTLRQKV